MRSTREVSLTVQLCAVLGDRMRERCCLVREAKTQIRSRDKRMLQHNENRNLPELSMHPREPEVSGCGRKIPRQRPNLACRQCPINSWNGTKGNHWVIDGGLVVQIQSQIIYRLDITDPGGGARCLKNDLNVDDGWITLIRQKCSLFF